MICNSKKPFAKFFFDRDSNFGRLLIERGILKFKLNNGASFIKINTLYYIHESLTHRMDFYKLDSKRAYFTNEVPFFYDESSGIYTVYRKLIS